MLLEGVHAFASSSFAVIDAMHPAIKRVMIATNAIRPALWQIMVSITYPKMPVSCSVPISADRSFNEPIKQLRPALMSSAEAVSAPAGIEILASNLAMRGL
jgi:hypothetical protein